MSLFVLGINHQTAPLALREQMAFNAEQIPAASRHLLEKTEINETVIVSTCNRTEIYCVTPDANAGRAAVNSWLASERAPQDPNLAERLYVYEDVDAIRHLLRVACGLDSLVLGEPQILGQLKQAYQLACEQDAVDALLHRLFQHAFATAKQVRTQTEIGANPVSVAFAAVSLARQIFGQFDNCTALLIGAGETIELTARHLHDKGLGRMIVANRTLSRAHAIAETFSGFAIELDELPAHLGEADIVIASTASPDAIVSLEMARKALNPKRRKPVFMVDLAVPRDIEAAVGDLEDVYLYTVDDLQGVIEESQRARRAAATQADDIIRQQTDIFSTRLRALDVAPMIQDLRTRADTQRAQVLAKAQRMLAAGKAPDAVLNYLANALTNRLLHAPSKQLRQAAQSDDTEFLEQARRLLNLE